MDEIIIQPRYLVTLTKIAWASPEQDHSRHDGTAAASRAGERVTVYTCEAPRLPLHGPQQAARC